MWKIHRFDEIDSTNTALKRLTDAPHGTVFVAKRQTCGRGRLGRSFVSPHGIYLSVLLRRSEQAHRLVHLTAMTAVAVRRAIFDASGIRCGIKWVNDLLIGDRKLCGILVESCNDGYIIGVGINCNTDTADFPPEVRQMAATVSCDEETLIAALVRRLQELDECLISQQAQWMQEYASACITVGKSVQIIRGEERYEAFALGVDENAALLVRCASGEVRSISSGEVSVRGLYGYAP